MKAFSSRIACGSFINWPIVLGVLLKRQANWFVRATALVAGLPLNNTGAVEADRVLVEFGAAAASCGPLFRARSVQRWPEKPQATPAPAGQPLSAMLNVNA